LKKYGTDNVSSKSMFPVKFSAATHSGSIVKLQSWKYLFIAVIFCFFLSTLKGYGTIWLVLQQPFYATFFSASWRCLWSGACYVKFLKQRLTEICVTQRYQWGRRSVA